MNTGTPIVSTHPIPARINDRKLAALKALLPPAKPVAEPVAKPVAEPEYHNPAQYRIKATLLKSLKISVPNLH